MKKSITVWFVLLFCIVLTTYGQNKLITLEDIYLNYAARFYPEYLRQLQWQPGTWNYTFVQTNNLIRNAAKKDGSSILLTLDELNASIHSRIASFPQIRWMDENRFYFMKNDSLIIFNVVKKTPDSQIILPAGSGNTDFFCRNLQVAFTLDSNLYVSAFNKQVKITSDGGKDIVYGTSVHRNEFGITKGTFWSPEGNYLAFYRMDESMVTDYPLVDVTTRIATVKNIKYPMAGMTSHYVKVGVYDVRSQNTVYLETGEPLDHYLTNIAWSPDEKYVFIAVLNREQNHMWLNQYDALTGKFVKTLFEEQDPHYVEPVAPMYILADGSFIWPSRRNGFNHLYLYSPSGKLIKQLTSGNWEVIEILKSTKKGEVFFTANMGSPIEKHLCAVNLMTGKVRRVTSEEGVHACEVSDDGSYVLDSYSSSTVPGKTDILYGNGKQVRNILTAGNPLTDYKLGDVTVSTILANDGKTPLYFRLIKPTDFDPSKKYPVVIYLYGGPHNQLVTNEWPRALVLWQQYLAERGYVCFTIDNRGSELRGRDFENIIHRQVGVTEMQDQITGVNYLKSLGFVDSTRMGVHGWSFGGFLTTSLMVNYPEVFKVAVAGGPVMDWRYYEVMYGERYMDTPQENPGGYDRTSCLNKTKNLKGKLLIIHGAMDPTVVWQNSLLFLQNCIKNNRQVDYFVYPQAEHNVIGKDRLHLMQKVTDYFMERL